MCGKDELKLMRNRKTLHKVNNVDFDCVLKEGICQCCTEYMTHNDSVLIIKQVAVITVN